MANRVWSLRARYLALAVGASVILVFGILFAAIAVNRILDANAGALERQQRLERALESTRDALLGASEAVTRLLVAGGPQEADTLREALRQATLGAARLRAQALGLKSLEPALDELLDALKALHELANVLVERRRDPAWVYPALPYITERLLQPNVAFETAATEAMEEIAQEDGGPYRSERYGAFDRARDTWRRIILNFRAVMIRYAGLPELDPRAEEANIDTLFAALDETLDDIRKLEARGALGLVAEESLATMVRAAQEWRSQLRRVRALRGQRRWRGDIEFVEARYLPQQRRALSALRHLESDLTDWAATTVRSTREANQGIMAILIALAVFSAASVGVLFLVLERSLLRPLARIADALTADAESGAAGELPRGGSREIATLVAAFETLRHQIRARQDALEHQALHDTLTGLPNRALFQDRLEQALNAAVRRRSTVAVLLLDLDRFKEVNDTLGHQAGDRLLQAVAERLQELLRESDTVARLGGDEFAVLAPDSDRAGAERLAAKIAGAVDRPFRLGEQELYVGASVGIAIAPEHTQDPADLVRRADVAMYVAKRSGQDFVVYGPEQDQHHVQRLRLLADLRRALDAGEGLELVYQPTIHLADHRPAGVECLLRWDHPELGAIAPEEVVELAEHAGLIGRLTRWVLEAALSDCDRCLAEGVELRLAVNLSPRDLQDSAFPEAVGEALARHRLPPGRLVLEVTESAVMSDPGHARETMERLHHLGVHLSVDDFGTGFSSLAYLKLLPVDALKIDRSFVLDMLQDENDAAIVRSTIDLGHNLGLQVIAEGVEDSATLARLERLGCDCAQGFYIGEPMTRAALATWWRSRQTG